MSNDKHFWMIYNQQGLHKNPTVNPKPGFSSELAVTQRAAELAKQHPGQEFFLLESRGSVRCPPPNPIYSHWPSGADEPPKPKQYGFLVECHLLPDGNSISAAADKGVTVEQALVSAVQLSYEQGKSVHLHHNLDTYYVKAEAEIPF